MAFSVISGWQKLLLGWSRTHEFRLSTSLAILDTYSFMELSHVLDPGKQAKPDKTTIISDAIKLVVQLRAENGQLKQLNKFLEV
jgi:hypothetical protein